MSRSRTRIFAPAGVAGILTLAACLAVVGCGGTPATRPDPDALAGSSFTVGCPHPAVRAEFEPRIAAWANRNGVTVKVLTTTDADVLLVPATDIGGPAAAGDLLPVPESVRGDTSAVQWSGLLRVYQDSLVQWGGRECAVPLAGEGAVLVFRADRLDDPAVRKAIAEKYRRDPLPIRSWEDLAEVAAAVTAVSGKPSLAPLPASATESLTRFCQIAACYDRAPVNSGERRFNTPTDQLLHGGRGDSDPVDHFRRGKSFLVDAETGQPRFTAPAFAEALRWLHATAKYRPAAPGDPVDALVDGSAVAAVLSLADLARLPRDAKTGSVEGRYGVAVAPGARSYFDVNGTLQQVTSPNRVPYYAGSGAVGVVRKAAAKPEACWRLLGDLAGPTGHSVTLDAASLGSGPLRVGHLSDDPKLWRQYRLDEARTADLSRAMQQYAATGALNPAVGLRTPDAAAVTDLIVKQVRRVAGGEIPAEEGVKQVQADWDALDAKTPEAERKAWRRKSSGTN